MLDLMFHVAMNTLSMNEGVHGQATMTSCRRNVKEYAGAMLVQVMQIRAGLWCGSSSVCSQLTLVHMIGRGSRLTLVRFQSSNFGSTSNKVPLSPPLIKDSALSFGYTWLSRPSQGFG